MLKKFARQFSRRSGEGSIFGNTEFRIQQQAQNYETFIWTASPRDARFVSPPPFPDLSSFMQRSTKLHPSAHLLAFDDVNCLESFCDARNTTLKPISIVGFERVIHTLRVFADISNPFGLRLTTSPYGASSTSSTDL